MHVRHNPTLENAKQALENGETILSVKKMLEEAGFITVYKELQIKGSWLGSDPDGWKAYYYYGESIGSEKNPIEIRCPRCNKLAICTYLTGKRVIVKCSKCHLVDDGYELKWSRWLKTFPKGKFIFWPKNAYYQWNIRGNILYANNQKHAQVLLDFLGGKERDPHKFPGYIKSLQKLPREITAHNLRETITKRISLSLKLE